MTPPNEIGCKAILAFSEINARPVEVSSDALFRGGGFVEIVLLRFSSRVGRVGAWRRGLGLLCLGKAHYANCENLSDLF